MSEALHAVQATMIVTVLLTVKFVYTNIGSGVAKARAGLRAAEDRQAGKESVRQEDLDAADRAQRIVNNDLENISFGLIAAWASVLCILNVTSAGPSARAAKAHVIFVSIFAACRVCHTVVYLLKLTLLRSLMWFLALLAMFAMAVNAAVAAFIE